MERSGTESVARAAVKAVGGVPSRRLATVAGNVGPANRQIGCGGATRRRAQPASEIVDGAAGRGARDFAGLRADAGRREPLSTGRTSGELLGAESALTQLVPASDPWLGH